MAGVASPDVDEVTDLEVVPPTSWQPVGWNHPANLMGAVVPILPTAF